MVWRDRAESAAMCSASLASRSEWSGVWSSIDSAIARDRPAPLAAGETIRRGRLGPGELLLVEPGRRTILEDTDAKAWALRHLPIHDEPRPLHEDTADAATLAIERGPALDHAARYLAGLDDIEVSEALGLSVKAVRKYAAQGTATLRAQGVLRP